MKTLALTLAATALTATAALAAKTDIAEFDVNGDGFATKSEVAAVFPGFTSSDFRSLDQNRDNRVSAVELADSDARSVVLRYEGTGNGFTDLGAIDRSGDGFASFEELAAVYPGITASEFRSLDNNDDRRISAVELNRNNASIELARHVNPGTVTDLGQIDGNGDNFAQFGELSAIYPGLSALDFREIDTNDDQRISSVELYDIDAQSVLNRAGS